MNLIGFCGACKTFKRVRVTDMLVVSTGRVPVGVCPSCEVSSPPLTVSAPRAHAHHTRDEARQLHPATDDAVL